MWQTQSPKIFELNIFDRRENPAKSKITSILIAVLEDNVERAVTMLSEIKFIDFVDTQLKKYGEIRIDENVPFTVTEVLIKSGYKHGSDLNTSYIESCLKEGKVIKAYILSEDGVKTLNKALWEALGIDQFNVYLHDDELRSRWIDNCAFREGNSSAPESNGVNW